MPKKKVMSRAERRRLGLGERGPVPKWAKEQPDPPPEMIEEWKKQGLRRIPKGAGPWAGRLLPGNAMENAVKITKETSQDMHIRRRELGQASVRRWLVEFLSRNDKFKTILGECDFSDMTETEAWGMVAALEAVKVINSDIPRPEAVKELGINTGFRSDRTEVEQRQGPVGALEQFLESVGGENGADVLLMAVQRRREEDSIDAVVRDVD